MTAPLDEKGMLPCPFCGGPVRTFQYNGTTQASCAALHTECAGTDVVAPVAMWNRRHLSAVALPDELEGKLLKSAVDVERIFLHRIDHSGEDWRLVNPDGPAAAALMREAQGAISQAHSTIAALRAEVEHWRGEARRLLKSGQEALDAAETAEAEVKRLTEEKEALRVGVEHVETLSELLKIIKDHWVDYDHVFSIAVDEADKFVSSQALSGSKE